MANFTGSDWCGWCKRLTKSVFVHDEFKEWADENVVLLELDYPRRKTLPKSIREQNAKLQRFFKVRGYPSVWMFDLEKDGTGDYVITQYGKTGYKKTVDEFVGEMNTHLEKSKARKSS